MTNTPSNVRETVEWFRVLLAVTAAVPLVLIYIFWTPSESNRLGVLFVNAIPSAIVILIAIPIVYYVFYRRGLSPSQLAAPIDIRELAAQIQHQLNLPAADDADVISWTEFDDTVQKLQSVVLHDPGFTADVVMSVGRSGAIAGALLAGNLGTLRHLGIDRIHAYEEGIRNTELWPPCGNFESILSNKNVLVVMAECITGGTLRLARDKLREKVSGIGDIRTAAVFRSDHAWFNPDYIGAKHTGKDLVFRRKTWRRDSIAPPRY